MSVLTFAEPNTRTPRPAYATLNRPRMPRHISQILDYLDERRTQRRPWVDRMWLDRERASGLDNQHWWSPNTWTGVWGPVRKPLWRQELLAPYVLSSLQRSRSLIGRSPVRFLGVPESSDPDDIQSASAATRYLRYLHDDLDMERKRADFVHHLFVDGHAYLLEDFSFSEDRGDIHVVPAHEIYPDPWAESLRASMTVIRERYEHISVVRKRWGKSRDSVLRDLAPLPQLPADVRRRLGSLLGVLQPIRESQIRDIIRTVEVWQRPGAVDPTTGEVFAQGRYTVLANEEELYDAKKLPYADAGVEIPIQEARYFYKLGQYSGESAISAVWTLLRAIEKLVGQGMEHSVLMCHGKWWVDKSIDLNKRLTTEPGERIPYDSRVVKPGIQITPQPLPPAFYLLIDRLEAWIYDILAMHEPTRGEMPKRVDSGRAIAYLQNADSSSAQDLYRVVDEAEGDALLNILKMERRHATRARQIQIVGKDRTSELESLNVAQLHGTKDVKVISAATLSPNPSIRRDEVAAMVERKLITEEDGRHLIEMPVPEGELHTLNSVNAEAARDNIRVLKSGQSQKIYVEAAWHLPTHDFELRMYMATAEYRALPDDAKNRVRGYFFAIENEAMRREIAKNELAAGGAGAVPPPGVAEGGMSQTETKTLTTDEPQGIGETANVPNGDTGAAGAGAESFAG